MDLWKIGDFNINPEYLAWTENTNDGGVICNFAQGIPSLTLTNPEDVTLFNRFCTSLNNASERHIVMEEQTQSHYEKLSRVGTGSQSKQPLHVGQPSMAGKPSR